MRLPTQGIVDSGADSSMFPLEFAEHLGIELASCRREECQTAGGPATQHIWEEGLDVLVQGINRTVHLGASFSETPSVLLGRSDFFQAFRVTSISALSGFGSRLTTPSA
jgi:hypothetical protein